MGDVLHSKAVLKLPADPARSAYLSLMLPMEGGKGEDYRCLPCRPKGEPRRTEGPEWEYEIHGDVLHVQPSMNCLDRPFHTDFHWQVGFAACPPDARAYDLVRSLNPEFCRP